MPDITQSFIAIRPSLPFSWDKFLFPKWSVIAWYLQVSLLHEELSDRRILDSAE